MDEGDKKIGVGMAKIQQTVAEIKIYNDFSKLAFILPQK